MAVYDQLDWERKPMPKDLKAQGMTRTEYEAIIKRYKATLKKHELSGRPGGPGERQGYYATKHPGVLADWLQTAAKEPKGPGLGQPGGQIGPALPPGLRPPGMPGGGGPGGGGAPDGGYGQVWQRLQSEASRAEAEAKAANEARYADILKGYEGRYERGMKGLDESAQYQRSDLAQAYGKAGMAAQQGLVSSGLSGSTVASTARMGNVRRQQEALNRLNADLDRRKAALDASLSRDTLAFKERREDTYPNMGQIAQLAQGLGQSGYWGAQAMPAPASPQATTPAQAQTNAWKPDFKGQRPGVAPPSATVVAPAPTPPPPTQVQPLRQPVRKKKKGGGFARMGYYA